jgi:hypothetical protein
LIRVAEEFHFKIATFQHVLEGYKVADEIAKSGSGASTFSDWWAYKVEAYDAIPYNAALMTERGIVVSINSDSGEEARHINQEAAKSMKWGGLSHDEALKLVTINPAIQLHIADRVGSIEAGYDGSSSGQRTDPGGARQRHHARSGQAPGRRRIPRRWRLGDNRPGVRHQPGGLDSRGDAHSPLRRHGGGLANHADPVF